MNSESNSSDNNDVNILMNKLNQKLAIHEESCKFKSFNTRKCQSQINQTFVKTDSPIQFDKPVSNMSDFIKNQLKETRSTEEIRSNEEVHSNGFILPKLLMPNRSNTNIIQDSQNFEIPLLERFRLQNNRKTKQLCDDMKNLQIEKEQKLAREQLGTTKPLIDLTSAINYNVNKAEAIALSLRCKQARLKAIEARNVKVETFDSIQNIKDTYREIRSINITKPKALTNPTPLGRLVCLKWHPKLKHTKQNNLKTSDTSKHTIKRFTFNTPSPDDIVLEKIRKIRSSYMHK